MPEYYPDLESVKKAAEFHSIHQKPENLYKGLIPQSENDLPQARKELAQYMREVWKSELAALEIELAVDEDNYNTKLEEHIKKIWDEQEIKDKEEEDE